MHDFGVADTISRPQLCCYTRLEYPMHYPTNQCHPLCHYYHFCLFKVFSQTFRLCFACSDLCSSPAAASSIYHASTLPSVSSPLGLYYVSVFRLSTSSPRIPPHPTSRPLHHPLDRSPRRHPLTAGGPRLCNVSCWTLLVLTSPPLLPIRRPGDQRPPLPP